MEWFLESFGILTIKSDKIDLLLPRETTEISRKRSTGLRKGNFREKQEINKVMEIQANGQSRKSFFITDENGSWEAKPHTRIYIK